MTSTPTANISFADGARDAETAGRVLAIDDDEIERERFLQSGQLGGDHVAPRLADDVAEE